MTKIALVGARGYIGSSLYKQLKVQEDIKVIPVIRENYEMLKKRKYDVVINSAMPAARYWAKNNPREDFRETVEKTADIVYGWNYKKMIQISTISARSETDTIYGKHKAMAEELCLNNKNLIVRLTATFDDTLSKGVLIDILTTRNIFVDKKSSYSFADLNFVTKWITEHLEESGIVEVGAKNAYSISDIAENLKLNITCNGPQDIQIVANPRKEFPDASRVLDFMKKKIREVDS